MTGLNLKTSRLLSHWTQARAAKRLGVTQAYLSMIERGERPVSDEVSAAALKVFVMPAIVRPLGVAATGLCTEEAYKRALAELGYPGFAYLRGKRLLNPAELLLLALDAEDLDSRVTEALPWLPFRFPDLNWDWLIAEAKLRDRQNRLGFVTELGRQAAEAMGDYLRVESLAARLVILDRSRLAAEGTLCNDSMSSAERRWVRSHRTAAAKHWNLLTDLKLEHLSHVYCATSD